MKTIAVDAVGGDHYPEAPVAGAIEAVSERSDINVLLCGPEQQIAEELEKHDYDSNHVHIQHAPQVIGMDESPANAVKTKQKSSIVTALGLQKAGKVQAFISAGNTGALLAGSTFILGKLEGVSRPTIAAIFPTIKGSRLLLDAGANLEMKDGMFVQFAQMGTIYVRDIMDIESPQVGLLNVGSEDEKGTSQLKNAFNLLEDLPNFTGNVEGNDIFSAGADIFLANGMVGNMLLKMGESVPRVLKQFIAPVMDDMQLGDQDKQMVFGVLKNALRGFDPDTVGGVPFLGVDGVSMVGHGSSSSTAIKNMILNAVKCIESDLNDKIVSSLK